MPFSSITFLFLFLPLFLSVYYLAPRAWRNGVALAGSLLFYAWGAPRFVLVLTAVSVVDYWVSLQMAVSAVGSRRRTALLTLAVSGNLSLLFYFKYANFAVREANALAGIFGRPPVAWTEVALPMGISFVVFEEISYLVDVYRGTTMPARRLSDYSLFLSLFPHSIAGPIFRWRDMEQQLRERSYSIDGAFDGFLRFCFGLAKKVLVANQVASIADAAFGHELATLPSAYAWLGLLAYTLQIYFDFSGYSDMAIGLGKLLGFSFKENFDAPYTAQSITDFWRRWHISLSTWLRDYLYIPLGGSRTTPAKRYRNLLVVFVVCGLWHGASFNFLVWGLYHGGWLVIERTRIWASLSAGCPRILSVFLTFLLVMFGWVFFRADTLPHAGQFFGRLLVWHDVVHSGTILSWGELLTRRAAVFGALGLAGAFIPTFPRVQTFTAWLVGKRQASSDSVAGGLLRFGSAALILSLSAFYLVDAQFNPFIYFRF